MRSLINAISIILLISFGVSDDMHHKLLENYASDTKLEVNSRVKDDSEVIYNDICDLNYDGFDDQVTVSRENNSICIDVNKSSFRIEDVYNEDNTFFDISPEIKIIDTLSNEKLVYIYYSYQVNGGTDGYYRAKLLRYNDSSLVEIWNTELDNEAVSFSVANEALTIRFDDREKDAKFFYNIDDARYDKANKIFDDFGKTSLFLKTGHTVKIYESELLNELDYNLDGKPEIITKNPIFFDEQYAYITSLFTIWSFSDHEMKLEKIFTLDRYSYESIIITKIIENGYLADTQLAKVLEAQMEDGNLTDNDVQTIMNKLIDRGIIIQHEDKFYIRMK